MSVGRCIGAGIVGLILATLPFAHYMAIGASVAPHADHQPQYGGQLGMVGDHHIEVRRQRGAVDVFVSDAWRHSLRPRHAWLRFAGGPPQSLVWRQHHLVVSDSGGADVITVYAVLDDGTELMTSFDFSSAGVAPQ